METLEHTALGNLIRFAKLHNNPYIRVNAEGTIHIVLQRFGYDGIPIPMNIEMSSGEIIAMAGDYFSEASWAVNLFLPSIQQFASLNQVSAMLLQKQVMAEEESAMMRAYNHLASPQVSRKKINNIYTIAKKEYFTTPSLNQYAQQFMFYLNVEDYSKLVDRNITHFSPWSIRVYLIGHTIALKAAALAREFGLWAQDSNYQTSNPEMQKLMEIQKKHEYGTHPGILKDIMHRFQAQALCMEFFTFHYYSDHYAAGHMSIVGDLRIELPQQFGFWGSVLLNNMHNELNKFGVYSKQTYNFSEDNPPILAQGDSNFDDVNNKINKNNCLAGMQASLQDIEEMFENGIIKDQIQFSGLTNLPDVDFNSRQYQPLFVLNNGRIFHRSNTLQIRLISPDEHQKIREYPKENGYTRLKTTWDAALLVLQLRTCIETQEQILTEQEMKKIEHDESKYKNKPLVKFKKSAPIDIPIANTLYTVGFLARKPIIYDNEDSFTLSLSQ